MKCDSFTLGINQQGFALHFGKSDEEKLIPWSIWGITCSHYSIFCLSDMSVLFQHSGKHLMLPGLGVLPGNLGLSYDLDIERKRDSKHFGDRKHFGIIALPNF